MNKVFTKVTDELNFFQGLNPYDLIKEFGSPLYVYNERILRQRCREMKNLVDYSNFSVNYSAKANSNLAFLQIVKSEGLNVDAMSPGEITMELLAGFTPEQIFYISNNVSEKEMQFAIDKNILMSVDSLSQLEQYGQLNPGGRIAARFNGGIGAGHHEKVVTAGKNTKFGITPDLIPQFKQILKKYNLKLVGINQHIGSLFMDVEPYVNGTKAIFEIAKCFEDLEFVDIGGGFGIPYKKSENQSRLNLIELKDKLSKVLFDFAKEYGKEIKIKIEPGRYISAECGIILSEVNGIKYNQENKYIGTDVGFNVLIRPAMYDSHHDIEIFRNSDLIGKDIEKVTIVGNICESGDILAKNIELPELFKGDVIAILDSGAYGYAMSSNYNNRLRPAEIFIREDNSIFLARKADSLEDLSKNYFSL